MARKIILETGYTFTPSTRTVVIPKYIPRERLVLITNVTTNQVIYNFSDPSLRATSYTATVAQNTQVETTTLVLNYNTALMAAADKLQITIDDYVEKFEPAETLLDPTNKLRVTEPQALIDTDFEYGTQITKWENLSTINQRPGAYQPAVGIPNITGIAMSAGSRTVTVTTSAAHGLTVGAPITVIDTYLVAANGNYVVDTVPTATTFTYVASSQNTTSMTAIFDANKTIVTQNALYTGAPVGGASPTNVTYSGSAVTVTFAQPHGLMVGNEIAVVGLAGATNPPNGAFFVTTVTSPTVLVYHYYAATISGTITFASAFVYPRPQGSVVHRPFDGGVLFTNGASSPNQMTSRQTRRYFRYQSGKGIQASSGTILKPNFQVDSLTSSGTTVTVQTKERHGLLPGAVIVVAGATETAYNGTFTIGNGQILSATKFQYTAGSTPSATPASGSYSVAVSTWYGSTNRLGIFDQQNGMFWEFDGTTFYAVRRSSTFQLSGRVSATAGSATITQTDASFPTTFSKQLAVGDSVVLRGVTYRVTAIASDTSMTVSPTYRGITSGMIVASKTVDTRVAQSAFNIDRLDGTGPSGYNLDLTKMQMFYIDYTWYGAGFIRFGVRGPQGNVIYCHKIPNNNVNTEAYMRSGNLPARYESATMAPTTNSTATISATDTIINVANNAAFPTAGTLCLRQGNLVEYVNYTGKTGTTQFTSLTRAQAGAASQTLTIASGATSGTVTANTGIQIGQRVIADAIPEDTYVTAISGTTITLSQAATAANPAVVFAPMAGAAQIFTFSATNPTSVELAIPQFGSSINHWGTSVIMDGKFDDDKSLVFTYGQTAFTNISAATTTSATTATGSVGAFSFTVASAAGILPGMTVNAVGVPAGSVVTSVVSTTVNINQPIATALSTTSITFSGGNSKALMSIRVAPSVDNGVTGAFGARELVNRVQLTLKSLGISTKTASANMLVRAYLNGVPNGSTTWTNAVGNAVGAVNSSLGQIADYAAGSIVVFGGETTAGFFVSGTDRLDLTDVRDLGNSILGGGAATSNLQVYPDGPDVLTVVVTNLGAAAIDVLGRLSWTEAQA